jgi:phosphatidylethanolamine-binding protein (PEBP) family uncharacterized protein
MNDKIIESESIEISSDDEKNPSVLRKQGKKGIKKLKRKLTPLEEELLTTESVKLLKPDVFTLKSKDFKNNEKLPKSYFCDKIVPNYPSLNWEGRVLNTKSFAILFYSTEKSNDEPFVYFIIYNIPNTVFRLDMFNFQEVGRFGLNSKKLKSYIIPCEGKEKYIFTLCALTVNNLLTVSKKEEIDFEEFNRICSLYNTYTSILIAKGDDNDKNHIKERKKSLGNI